MPAYQIHRDRNEYIVIIVSIHDRISRNVSDLPGRHGFMGMQVFIVEDDIGESHVMKNSD